MFYCSCFFQTTNVVVTPASANENTIGYVILYISLLAGKVKPFKHNLSTLPENSFRKYLELQSLVTGLQTNCY